MKKTKRGPFYEAPCINLLSHLKHVLHFYVRQFHVRLFFVLPICLNLFSILCPSFLAPPNHPLQFGRCVSCVCFTSVAHVCCVLVLHSLRLLRAFLRSLRTTFRAKKNQNAKMETIVASAASAALRTCVTLDGMETTP